MDDQIVRLVCFELCGTKFAFQMEHLVEIVQIDVHDVTFCATPVPLVRGLWDYRDKTLYVIDLREFFALEDEEASAPEQDSHKPLAESLILLNEDVDGNEQETALVQEMEYSKSMLVIRIRDHIFGLLTDTVLQVVPLGFFYEYPDLVSILPKRYFIGLTLMNGELVIILALENFLNEDEFDSLASYTNSQKIENNLVNNN